MSPSSLAPSLLLSMPQLSDPNFARSVVLLCTHDKDGAFGLIVNRPIVTSGRVVISLDPPVETERALQMWLGGPVEPQRSWMLVRADARDDHEVMPITAGLHLSTSPELLRQLVEADQPPEIRLVVGYAAWGPGQLEAELEASAWLLSDVDLSLIFETPAERMWEQGIRRLGADPGSLHTSRGVH